MNKSKAKGTRAESAVVKALLANDIKATRQALAGSDDRGDIYLEGRDLILEVKAGKQTANPNRSQIKEWIRQAKQEGQAAGCYWMLVVVRYGRKLADADVYMNEHAYGATEHMYFDELIEWLKNW